VICCDLDQPVWPNLPFPRRQSPARRLHHVRNIFHSYLRSSEERLETPNASAIVYVLQSKKSGAVSTLSAMHTSPNARS
jgi:hypothetical protein